MKNTWCPLPWIGLNVRNNGDVRVCCNANTSGNQGLPTKEDGTYYNLSKDSIRSHINSELMKEIRLSMLNGEYHPSCVRCEREDKAGMESRKEWEKTIWADTIDFDKSKLITNDDGSIDPNHPIKFADLRFGNLCNLKCRMCGPTDSNQWYEDQVKVWDVNHYNDSGMKLQLIRENGGRLKPHIDIYSWYENPEFWQNLEKEIPELNRIYIVGGEPLLIEQHYDFLKKCIERGQAHKMLVEYNSNLTSIQPRVWDIWKHFQRIQIGVSVDGYGKINDYIRHPSKWSQIEKNLLKLDSADGNFKIWIASTILVYNMMHLPEFMIWKIKQNYKNINSVSGVTNRPIITPHPLHKPEFLNIKIFPMKAKKIITNYFNECKIKYKDFILGADYSNQTPTHDIPGITYAYFCRVLDNYIKYMNADDWSNHLSKFWNYTNKLDEIREESFYDVDPVAWELLEGSIHGIK